MVLMLIACRYLEAFRRFAYENFMQKIREGEGRVQTPALSFLARHLIEVKIEGD